MWRIFNFSSFITLQGILTQICIFLDVIIKNHQKSSYFIKMYNMVCVICIQFSHSVMSDFLRPLGLQHTRPPCPSPTPGAYSNSCPLSQWCHPNISSSVVPFSSHLQSFPASGSLPVSQFFASGSQIIGVPTSASVFPSLPNSNLKKAGKTTRPFRYDLNQIPYDYTVEVICIGLAKKFVWVFPCNCVEKKRMNFWPTQYFLYQL